ncbi:MAG: hypothetical protein KKE96_02095 [Candidatus Altiarchaeota archaeon]|nr:hypothetical protein [Candidatus Altiarchaeota archaeon]
MDRCPTCKRKFEMLEDYPIIHLIEFRRKRIPADIAFPFTDDTPFVEDPSKLCFSKKVPKGVVKLLRESKGNAVEYNGWRWQQEGCDKDVYTRSQNDQKETILEQLEPYLKRLESLAGKTLPAKEFFPGFKRDGYFKYAFTIPKTGHWLSFMENRRSRGHRRVALHVLKEGNIESAGKPALFGVAHIGTIKYDGRIENDKGDIL